MLNKKNPSSCNHNKSWDKSDYLNKCDVKHSYMAFPWCGYQIYVCFDQLVDTSSSKLPRRLLLFQWSKTKYLWLWII